MRLGIKAALLAGAAVVVGCVWTAGASAVFLWGTGLLRHFPFEGHAWAWQFWSYLLNAPPHPLLTRWFQIGAAVPTAVLGLVAWRVGQLRGTRAVRPGTTTVTYQPEWDEAAPTVAAIARPGDLVITVGCGDVTKVAPLIVGQLERRAAGVR